MEIYIAIATPRNGTLFSPPRHYRSSFFCYAYITLKFNQKPLLKNEKQILQKMFVANGY